MQNYRWVREVFGSKELDAPFILDSDCAYFPALKEKLNFIYEKAMAVSAPEKICSTINEISEDLIRAIDFYYRGDIGDAQKTIIRRIRAIKKMPLAVSGINDSISFIGPWHRLEDYQKGRGNTKLFHARLSDKVVTYSKRDMQHIPFDKRDLMQPQRFSLSGLPCYYLASTSYCCWIEMDRPSESEFNVSAVRPTHPFKILNLGVSGSTLTAASELIESGKKLTVDADPDDIMLSLICLRVLAIATSFRVKRSADHVPFKSEYILSQLIMLAVKSLNLDGISYFSKRIFSDAKAFPVCVNLALFAPYDGQEKESSICHQLLISDPVNYAEYKQLGIPEFMIRRNLRLPRISLARQEVIYESTYFHSLDKDLQKSLDEELSRKKDRGKGYLNSVNSL